MASNVESDVYGTNLSIESMKIIAEGIGISYLPDDAAKELAEDVSYKLKQVIQDAAKFMHHAKRCKLSCSDVDNALRLKNIEPQYGHHAADSLPFRFASGGGRELHFIEDREVDLNELISNSNPRIPLDASVHAHWLCIDGVQPTVPENPPPLCRDMQQLESVDPMSKQNKPNKESSGKPTTGKRTLRNVETVQIKQLATHELSVEQQIYYKEITEACVGSDETRRTEALQSLASDPGIFEMLPRMCTFIMEGVRVNVVQNNLALLIYLMRMVKAMLDNQTLFLEKYLHELIPSVITCIVSRQLCIRPELDNHWALRDFASRLMAQICKNFNTSTNNIQTRVTRLFGNALQKCDSLPLTSLYGSLQALSELGTEVIKAFILPEIKTIGTRIEVFLDGSTAPNLDKLPSINIMHLLIKVLTPIIKTIRSPPDNLEDYKTEYGYLGTALHMSVLKARAVPSPAVTPANNAPPTPIPSAVPRSLPAPGGIIPGATTPGRTIVMNPSSRVPTPSGNQKIVFLTQRAQGPVTPAYSNQSALQNQPNSLVKVLPNINNSNQQPKVGSQQKIVVVCMPNAGTNSTPTFSTSGSTNMNQQKQIITHQNIRLNQDNFSSQPTLDDMTHME